MLVVGENSLKQNGLINFEEYILKFPYLVPISRKHLLKDKLEATPPTINAVFILDNSNHWEEKC